MQAGAHSGSPYRTVNGWQFAIRLLPPWGEAGEGVRMQVTVTFEEGRSWQARMLKTVCKAPGLLLMLHFAARGKEQPGHAQAEERFNIHLQVRLEVAEKSKRRLRLP